MLILVLPGVSKHIELQNVIRNCDPPLTGISISYISIISDIRGFRDKKICYFRFCVVLLHDNVRN